jgi:cysteine desulfurase/selenocysteine lyase
MKMIYMDNAATSWPKPDIVYDTVLRTMKYYGANPGRSSHTMAIEAANILLYTREMLCQLFNVQDPFRMIFTYNTTDSLNLAIKGILNKGDHVITTSMEHNSVIRPLMHLADQGIGTTICRYLVEISSKISPKGIPFWACSWQRYSRSVIL